jgi:Secretion system C-terminal sorting domain
MKQIFLLTMLLANVFNTIHSQITIPKSFFPTKGDTLLTAMDITVANIKIPKNGINQVWDFTSLNGVFGVATRVKAANTGNAFAKFPNADLVENRNGVDYYINVTSTKYEEIGLSGPVADFFGLNTTTQIAPANVLRRAPMSFLDLNSSSTATLVTFPIIELPDSLFSSISQYLELADSIRIIKNTTRTDLVDGYGTLKLPIGNYDVLREKQIRYSDSDLEVRIKLTKSWFGLKQLIPANLLPAFLKKYLGKDTTITYNFYAANVKEPLAIATVDNNDNTKSLRIEYKSNFKKTTAVKESITETSDYTGSPNPTQGMFNLTGKNKIETVEIFDLSGCKVMTQKFDNQSVGVDLSVFQHGFYIVKINHNAILRVVKL